MCRCLGQAGLEGRVEAVWRVSGEGWVRCAGGPASCVASGFGGLAPKKLKSPHHHHHHHHHHQQQQQLLHNTHKAVWRTNTGPTWLTGGELSFAPVDCKCCCWPMINTVMHNAQNVALCGGARAHAAVVAVLGFAAQHIVGHNNQTQLRIRVR